MDRRKKRWLLGCGCLLTLGVLAVLAWFVWPVVKAYRKPGPIVVVVTCHPGMPASSIEKTITNRIERWCIQAAGAQFVTSRSLVGVSMVRVFFRRDIQASAALQQIDQLARSTIPLLPANTQPPITLLHSFQATEPVGVVSVDSQKADEATLTEVADRFVRSTLLSIAGASPSTVLGGRNTSAWLHINGRRAVGVLIFLQNDAKPVEVDERISAQLPSLESLSLEDPQTPRDIKLRWMRFGKASKGWWSSDDGLLTIHLRGPSTTRLAETENHVTALEEFLENNIPAMQREAIVCEMGMTPTVSAKFTANAGPMDATLFVQLSRDRTLSAAEYAAKLRRGLQDDPQFADLRFRFVSHDMPAPVDVRIAGGKRDEMMSLARQVRGKLASIAGAVDVDIAQRLDAPFLVITADADKAAAVGLSSEQVLRQLAAALEPRLVLERDFWIDKQRDEHSIAIPFSSDLKIEDVSQREATGTNVKQPVKLSSLARLQRITSAVEIDHVSLQSVLDVRANIAERNRGEVIADIRKMIAELQVPQGMQVELVGEK